MPNNNINTEYYNTLTGERYMDIWGLLKGGLWKKIKPENFQYNIIKGVLKRNEWIPVLGDILPFYREMEWDKTNNKAFDRSYRPKKIINPDTDSVIEAAKNFFLRYSEKKIGVQLSGGLDSSIIIGLLRHLKIPFYLIGMTTNRYEFRTEKYIQLKLQEWAESSTLIDYEEHLPMSNLDIISPFQYPDLLVLNQSSEHAMACECNKFGVEVLLTGDGGDNVFADQIPNNFDECDWVPNIFSNDWLADNIYAPLGIELTSFYADPGIMDAIYNLRLGADEDVLKFWARSFFKEFLPVELVNYTYHADFWGLYMDGLHQVSPVVKELFHNAYEITGHSFFSKDAIQELFSHDLLHAKKELYQKIESRVAFAVWIDRLINTGVIS